MGKVFLCGLLLLASMAAAGDLLPASVFVPPPRALTLEGRNVVFRADGFRYESADGGMNWEVEVSSETVPVEPLFRARRVFTDTTGVETIFQSVLGRDEARVLIRRFEDGKVVPVADLLLYDRWAIREALGRRRGRKLLLTPDDTLASAPKPAPALFSEIRRAGNSLWLGVGWEAGPNRGVGALVRHELDTGETRVFRPLSLENWGVARLALTPDAVWLVGAHVVDGRLACRTLARFEPRQEKTDLISEPLRGADEEILVLEATGDTVWLATQGSLRRAVNEGDRWSRWNLRSTIRVAQREEVSNLPGEPSRRAIPSGTYTVLGMTSDSLLVETHGGVEGWVMPDAAAEDPVRLYERPVAGSPILGLYPAGPAIERQALRTADGWQRARARVGWLSRAGRTPRPVVVEDSEERN